MIKLFTDEEFNNAKSNDKLSLRCVFCNNVFLKKKKYIKSLILGTLKGNDNDFCNIECFNNNKTKNGTKEVSCKNCSKKFIKTNCNIKKSKNNNFCSSSCSATYNNFHKTKGNRRSKLEIWLEKQLDIIYPNLEIKYNKKDAINSELDIYIQSLSLAIELNGIFHYEPIYGQDKLDKIQNNDNRKFQACIEKNIELCIIDSSSLSYFKESNAKKYLDIIINLINLKISGS